MNRTIRRTALVRVSLVALAWSALWAPVALAQAITPDEIVATEQVGAVAISPDGTTIAYTLTKPRGATDPVGRSYSELWIVSTAGGEATVLVAAPHSAGSPAWSPSGDVLAFTAHLGLDDRTQVYGVAPGGGEPRLLTHSPLGVTAYAWSPDGASIAYTAREPEPPDAAARRERGDDVQVAGEEGRHVRLWIENVRAATRHAVTPADRTVRSFAWMPDGSGFALQITETTDIDASYMFRRLFTVHAAGNALQPLTDTKGKLGEMAWSPDGRNLAYLGAVSLNDPLAQSVFVVPRTGGEAVNRTVGYEGSVLSLDWLDNERIAILAAEGTRTVLHGLEISNGERERLAGGGAEIISGISMDRRHRTFAAAVHTANHPREVYAARLGRAGFRRITHHNPWLGDIELARQETIEWSGADGWRIEGVLVHPLHETPGQRYPLAILPHGGPEGISYDGWTTSALYPAQFLAAHGYAVLMPNYRGSGGRGVAFSKGDHRDLGGKEFVDVITAIDHLADTGLIDPDRVGISGTSYGGYFSALAATKYSQYFKAAIPYAGISNWMSFTGTTEIPYEMSIVHWDTWWFEDPGLSWDRSPLAHINESRTATLVGHGLADTRVDPGQSVELYTALRIKGVPSGLVLYPREPHGLLERAHQLDFMNRVLSWFETYLKGPASTSE